MANDPPIDPLAEEHDPPHALPRGTLLNDKFRLQRVIGVGGFGIVYLAHDEMSDVKVAIKEYMPTSLAGRTKTMQVSLTSQSNAETFALGLKSFWNEARLLARFRDEQLPLLKVYDAFQANGTAYMVMPVLRGRTAYQVRREMPKPPSERWLRTLLTDLLPALERLHAENVFHRDIAPDNIQIDIHAKPVLMDLGAARHVISNRTQSITAILKPGYAPIEQYGENEKLRQGPWTDIYALGATLHFLLLNKAPSSATSRMFDAGEPLVTQDLPGCSQAFLRVVDWMLAVRPEDRPQNVAQLRAALEESDPTTRIMAPKASKATPRAAVPPAAAVPAAGAPAAAAAPAAAPTLPVAPRAAPPGPAVPPAVPAAAPATAAARMASPADAAATVIAPPKVAKVSAASPPASAPAAAPTTPAAPSASTARPATPQGLTSAPPKAPAEISSVAAPAPGAARSPMPMVLAGLAALVVVGGAAAWLWPRQSAPTTAAARPSPASAPEVVKAPSPPAEPRTEATTLPATPTATLAAPPAPPVAATEQPTAAVIPSEPTTQAPPPPAAVAKSSETPAQAAAAAAKRASAPAATPPTAKKAAPVNDKDGALLPRPADPAPVAAVAPPPPPPPPPTPAPPPPAPAAAPAPPAVASPSERCADKDGFARTLCVSLVCGAPALHNHPECVAIRRR